MKSILNYLVPPHFLGDQAKNFTAWQESFHSSARHCIFGLSSKLFFLENIMET